jgi:5-methylcytosine-specific restriction endonuclease McrA
MRKIIYPFNTDKEKSKFLDYFFKEVSEKIPKQREICKKIKYIDPTWDLKKLLTADFDDLLSFVEKFKMDDGYLKTHIISCLKSKFSDDEEKNYIEEYFENYINNKSLKDNNFLKSVTVKEENVKSKRNKKNNEIKRKKKEIHSEIKQKLNFITNTIITPYEKDSIFDSIVNFLNKYSSNLKEKEKKKENFLNINSCFYCNIDYINTFNENQKTKNHFTLDHILPKSKYPFLSISLFNLVPCCSPCNSKFKHNKEFEISNDLSKLIPSSKEYILDEFVQFQLKFKVNEEDKLELKVDLTNLSNINNVDHYIEMFNLDGRYEFHKQKAEDLIDKRKIYSDSQIKEIAKLLGRDEQSIKEDIFGKECFHSNNEPFEKYKQDIAKQLGLV